ncbi:MAG: putative molybdenum carrier protein [Acidiferrobacterales bacterium]
MLRKLISGGQSGVDRAALDVALELAIPCGGWCPRGRKAEDGAIPAHYPLTQTESVDYAERTKRNVLDADATLILVRGALAGGTALTLEIASRYNKPYRVVDLSDLPQPNSVRAWLEDESVGVLNCAGPRESRCPGIYGQAARFLRDVLAETTDR